MLTRLRQRISKYLEIVGIKLYRCRLTPNAITLIGLFLSMLCPVAAFFRELVFVMVLMLLSSLADVMDGALARAFGRVTKFGSVLDSFSDRVSEFMFFYSLVLLGIRIELTLIALSVSFLVSYLRALGEKFGIKMEGVGLLERGERLILLLIAFIGILVHLDIIANISILLLILLGCITVIQRLLHLQKLLR